MTRHFRNPLLQAKWEIVREGALEKLKQDGKLVYDFIKGECEDLSRSPDPRHQFFYREGKWWRRIQLQQLWTNLRQLSESHLKAALKWLIDEGYILQNNFDKDYCSIKWYSVGDKPFPQDT